MEREYTVYFLHTLPLDPLILFDQYGLNFSAEEETYTFFGSVKVLHSFLEYCRAKGIEVEVRSIDGSKYTSVI